MPPAEPFWILITVIVGAALLLIEVGLPTLGMAGLAGGALTVLAGVGLGRADDPWWPLVLVAISVVGAGVLLARRRLEGWQPWAMLGLFGLGAVSYGVLAGDAATVVLAVVGSVVAWVGYPRLFGATRSLVERPSDTGFESLVGRSAEVVTWTGDRGVVRLEGSRWQARFAGAGPGTTPGATAGTTPGVTAQVESGDRVEVVDHDGLWLLIESPLVSADRAEKFVNNEEG